MTFDEWYEQVNPKHHATDDTTMLRLLRACWSEAKQDVLEVAAQCFDGTLPFNFVCADGYSNGFDVSGELRYMAHEIRMMPNANVTGAEPAGEASELT